MTCRVSQGLANSQRGRTDRKFRGVPRGARVKLCKNQVSNKEGNEDIKLGLSGFVDACGRQAWRKRFVLSALTRGAEHQTTPLAVPDPYLWVIRIQEWPSSEIVPGHPSGSVHTHTVFLSHSLSLSHSRSTLSQGHFLRTTPTHSSFLDMSAEAPAAADTGEFWLFGYG